MAGSEPKTLFFLTTRDVFSSGFRVYGGFLTWMAVAEPKFSFLTRDAFSSSFSGFRFFLDLGGGSRAEDFFVNEIYVFDKVFVFSVVS